MKKPYQLGLLAFFTAACSGEPDSTVLAPEFLEQPADPITEAAVPAAPKTADEVEAEFQAAFRTPLSDLEQRLVEDALSDAGMDLSKIRIVGRMVVKDDTYLSADDLLASLQVEKGVSAEMPFPNFFARLNGTTFEMRKPFFGFNKNLKVIVPNTTVRDIMQLAVDNVVNAADDCLTSSRISVILKSAWDALAQAQVGYSQLHIVHGTNLATVCPGFSAGTNGCARWPTSAFAAVSGSGILENRIIPGQRIGLLQTGVSGTGVNGTDTISVGIATHELMHALGVTHSFPESGQIAVPGTAGILAPASIMRAVKLGSENYCTPPVVCANSVTMQPDDILTLDTMYSPQPGSSCDFPAGFEPACAQACTKVSSVSVANHCCWCGGVKKSFKRSTFNANTYLCQ